MVETNEDFVIRRVLGLGLSTMIYYERFLSLSALLLHFAVILVFKQLVLRKMLEIFHDSSVRDPL